MTDSTPQEDGLCRLVETLKKCGSDRERIEAIDRFLSVHKWCQEPDWLRNFSTHLSPAGALVIKSLIAIGQEELLPPSDAHPERLGKLLEDLFPVQEFYREIGGIIGYHWTMVSLMSQTSTRSDSIQYHSPPWIDISGLDERSQRYLLEGILSLPKLAEIYPVGGAADRLGFCDPLDGQPLPAAKLPFGGHSLLEGLIRDIQGREYLYYKLFGRQTTTPVAMMTSPEKDNHRHLLELCESRRWFGRPKSAFRFFCQPLVPAMEKDGKWCRSDELKLLMKPGGHGVMWKLAKEEGIFEWLEALDRKKVLVRQINNPVAGVDQGILTFCGAGFAEDRAFGFASCPREVGSAEGVNLVLERATPAGRSCCLTNIEYCDFAKFGIEDLSVTEGSSWSRFPSNTNILFADLAAVQEAIASCPIPGMLVNPKKMSFVDEQGNQKEMEVARLESTMQNLADCFEEWVDPTMPVNGISLRTYLTWNHRRKTISTTKKQFREGGSLLETPEGCHYDQLLNAHDLLTNYCHISLPTLPQQQEYLEQGPSFLFSWHPALGPLFAIIGQKLRRGSFAHRSELKLEIAEVDIDHLTLAGSLHVIAENVVGEKNSDGIVSYSNATGKCTLRNVTVLNRGIDTGAQNRYWKDEITRLELCEIQILGNGEFIAENITLHGPACIEVQSGTRVTAIIEAGELRLKKELLTETNSGWNYHLAADGSIQLTSPFPTKSHDCRQGAWHE